MRERIETDSKITYRLNGLRHRPNGPAIILINGGWSWWLHGERHRYYGPIIHYTTQWAIHGDYK